MLKQEVSRATKKINETKTKTNKMHSLQQKNDEKVIRKMEQAQKNEERKQQEG